MMDIQLTKHARERLAQRAIARADVDLLLLIGTDVEAGYVVRQKDFQEFERALKQLRDRARRLVGKRVVIESGRVITAYHAGRDTERRLLRDIG